MTTLESTAIYHEIDFLLPTQRFNINFSYVTQRGLPFVREFVLRLVHLAPMTKTQVAIFFGFSREETDEAISDLVERGELTILDGLRLTLTEKSSAYFVELGEVPRLSLLRDSAVRLSFDLATFTCLGRDIPAEKWKAGLPLTVDSKNASRSAEQVEKHFQLQFHEILHKGFLPKALVQDEKDSPVIYTVNSVNKLRDIPFRLTTKFSLDVDGRSLEREDFEDLKSSDYIHEIISVELNRLARPNNFVDIAKAMVEFGDSETLQLFDSKSNSINLQFLDDLKRLEINNQKKRTTFLGPIYSAQNWMMLQKRLAPVLTARLNTKANIDADAFLWLAPSDPYWCKSHSLLDALSEFLNKANTNVKKLYSPVIYLPVSGQDDYRASRQWKQDLDPYTDTAHGVAEGFLGGNVEVMHFEGELVVVVYHISLPDLYPVTLPLGFISTDIGVVSAIGRLIKTYLQGSSGFERPNDCGLISQFKRNHQTKRSN